MMHITFASMNVALCLHVGMDAHLQATAQNAARQAFPQAVVKVFNTFDEALKSEPVSGNELLVLANPDEASLAKAVGTVDAVELRRSAIAVLGEAPSTLGVEVISQ